MGRIITRADIGYTDNANRLATAQEVISKDLDCSDTGNKLTDNIKINVKWYASDEGTYDILGSTTYFRNFTLYIESLSEHDINGYPASGYQIPVMSASTVTPNTGGHYHVIQTLSQNNDPATPQNPRVETVYTNVLASANDGKYHMRFKAIGVLELGTVPSGVFVDNIQSTPAWKTFEYPFKVLEYLNNNLITVSTRKSGNLLYVVVNIPDADLNQ